ncbi:transcription factor SPT8 [Plectosphaerella cucumerina]|uniref:Transcription factor SPT8 n=1 Tax=Plectosphaerella cucumerina TaxID=40658 RepID=A0A8K0TD26_9PEZI|nr:transcription factor SPT8 [Plectosphaerella cucumerina]
MDEDERESNASSENEQDEVMEDADDGEPYNDNDNDNENDNDNDEDDNDDDNDDGDRDDAMDDAGDATVKVENASGAGDSRSGGAEGGAAASTGASAAASAGEAVDTNTRATTSPSAQLVRETIPDTYSRLYPAMRQEALDARLYDIVPTMAAHQATSVNALAVTPDLRYWMTGGSDGYIRKYDGPATINGKQLLTVAQRHPFVDSVVKAGVLMSYWENEEPGQPNPRGNDEHVLSPVYSLAVHSEALWLLSGLESGGINLQSVRHDEGKRIACLQQHTNAVSVLTLAQDEKSVLSGSWDKNLFDWDLNTGDVKRRFEGIGGQISAIELRPVTGAPIPAEASETFFKSETFLPPNDKPLRNGSAFGSVPPGGGDGAGDALAPAPAAAAPEGQASPAHESLFGGSDTGSLFGENVGGGFGGEDDDEFSRAMNIGLHDNTGQDGGMDHSADMAMANSFQPDAVQPPAPEGSPEVTRADLPAAEGDAATNAPAAAQPTSPAPDFTAAASQPMPDLGPSQTETMPSEPMDAMAAMDSPSMIFNSEPAAPALEPSQSADTVFLSAAFDGTIRVWDRRVQTPVARISTGFGVPPWCMAACWSPDGNWIYAGRRNGTVEEYSIHKARGGWEPERALKFPAGSGPVSAVRAMPNGRHLICASHDILRLYDLKDTAAAKHSRVPFLIVPGPPRAGVISNLYIDRTCRYMLSTAGTRGWEGSSTEVLIGYEINVSSDKS